MATIKDLLGAMISKINDNSEVIANGGGASDCDWEIMKNKPFGEVVEDKYFLPEITITKGGYNSLDVGSHDLYNVNDTAKLEINGVIFDIEEDTYTDGVYGETTYFYYPKGGYSDYNDAPLYVSYVDENPNEGTVVVNDETLCPFTIAIKGEITIIKKLDEAYIPASIARHSNIPTVNHTWESLPDKPFGEAEKIVIFEENSISNAYIWVDRDLFGYPAVETCTVVFDGVKYVGSVDIYWDDMFYTDVINISFTLADGTKYVLTSGNDYSSFDDGSHTLEIYIGGEVVPLDEKYIQLTSPNGTKYKLTVSDDGTITAVVVE